MRNWVGLALVTSPQRLLLVTCLHKSACWAETEQLFASPPPLCAPEASLEDCLGPSGPCTLGGPRCYGNIAHREAGAGRTTLSCCAGTQ